MNKIFCLAATIVTFMFTSCKDYDSDIAEINDLQKYVDDELSEMEDWSLATFGNLGKKICRSSCYQPPRISKYSRQLSANLREQSIAKYITLMHTNGLLCRHRFRIGLQKKLRATIVSSYA